jgi:uncharacterized protein with GYD domain
MPIGFMRIKTSNPHADDPEGLEQLVRETVEAAGASLLAIYFAIGADEAVAVVEDLDDYVDVKAVTSAVGAHGFEKYVKTAHAREAIERRSKYRPPAA